ncbi:MAG: hypothetical protein RL722_1664, partial [Pseudomonadota bacterium]
MQFHDPVSSSASPLTLAPLPALAASPAGPGLSRRDLLGAATLVLSLGASDLARGASIVAVRVWPAAEYTRVTLESDTNLVGQHFLTGEPARLVIDVDGLELTNTLRDLVGKVSADDPYIARVRVGQNQPGKVRIVFDLKQATRPQVFALAPIAPYRHRLVFDLYPVRPASTAVALASGDGPAAAAPAPSASPASATSINPPASAAPALGSGGLPGEAGSTTAAPASAAAGDDDIMALLTRRPDAI